MSRRVRTRFAPSPTGGLHLGGVRTALFSYLYAKKHGGDFVLRIEDTDQTRFVPGAEDYIQESLAWCGLVPDESPLHGGPHAPYRQSERKERYKQFAEQLVQQGQAYYAFDTKEALEAMREQYKTVENPSPQYDATVRMQMHNSLTLTAEETQQLISSGTPYVVRIKVPQNEIIEFNDLIRGHVSFDSNTIDDKVLLKADGMPTYHLAVVVDDYEMQISHAFRGEEWLPSAPIHILLWRYLGWESSMPAWAHLPLILKPDGNGKLSKRDGDRLGFPVFAMDWTDNKTGETTSGFKERGYLPQAFVNILAMLGWNDGTERELFSLAELIESFDIERVHKGGAKFNVEKAQWYNATYIKQLDVAGFAQFILPKMNELFGEVNTPGNKNHQQVFELIKDRLNFITDLQTQASFFYNAPVQLQLEAVKPKWNAEKAAFFTAFTQACKQLANFDAASVEQTFKQLAEDHNIKAGELQLPMRIMLVGDKFGPAVFIIAEVIGCSDMCARIESALLQL
jgi:glutamyl-tRNA synthetase